MGFDVKFFDPLCAYIIVITKADTVYGNNLLNILPASIHVFGRMRIQIDCSFVQIKKLLVHQEIGGCTAKEIRVKEL